jgi:glutamate-1-semialdehyde 2,1-aminomutase
VKKDRSRELFERAKKVTPGGVNSPVRAFKSVGGNPHFIERADGAYLYDVDGNKFVDFVGSWGPMILGHNHRETAEALKHAVGNSTSFGAPGELEVEIAEFLTRKLPHLEMVRMVNSGTEATMSAIRLARGSTGRDKIIKISCCYHGHGDSLLVEAGSGALTFGSPSSPGVPRALAELTIVIPFNDVKALETALEKNKNEVACLIIEPLPGNMGTIPPAKGYLEKIRELTKKEGVLLIFDEVMSGFRVAFGGMVELSKVVPDLVTYGKIIGGGLPVGAYGGRRDLMEKISPQGNIYQAGTLSGNPLAMTAGLIHLKTLYENRDKIYPQLDKTGQKLETGLLKAAKEADIPATINRVGSMFTLFFTGEPVTDDVSARKCDTERFGKFFRNMLEEGIYLPPSQFETAFISTRHGEEEVAKTINAAKKALKPLRE